MAKQARSNVERARDARAAAVVCAAAMLGAAGWVTLKHGVGAIALDAERSLTLVVYLVAHALALFAAAHPAQALSRPLSARLAVTAITAASVNVTAAAFFAIDLALAWTALAEGGAAYAWVLAFLIPAGASIWVFLAGLGVPPEGADEISDEDLIEAALILTESQPRWSWRGVFAMAAFMSSTRAGILAAYFVCVVAGTALYQWLSKAFFESAPFAVDDLHRAGTTAVELGGHLVAQTWFWGLFFLVVVLPPLFILSAAVWYRWRQRASRVRLRTVSQSPAARLMTRREITLWRREVERPNIALRNPQRGVS